MLQSWGCENVDMPNKDTHLTPSGRATKVPQIRVLGMQNTLNKIYKARVKR